MEQPPKKSTAREVVETVVEGAVGMVPVFGSPAAVALSFAMGWAYSQRMQAWLSDVADAISELQEAQGDSVDFDKLSRDPEFVDVVVAATRAAQATSSTEKLTALRNAVVNSIGSAAPEEDLRLRFIRAVDQLSADHLLLLDFLADPRGWYDRHDQEPPSIYMGSKAAVIDPAFPQLAAKPDYLKRLLGDIESLGFAHVNYHVMATESGVWAPGTTSLGDQLLAFVRSPEQPED